MKTTAFLQSKQFKFLLSLIAFLIIINLIEVGYTFGKWLAILNN